MADVDGTTCRSCYVGCSWLSGCCECCICSCWLSGSAVPADPALAAAKASSWQCAQLAQGANLVSDRRMVHYYCRALMAFSTEMLKDQSQKCEQQCSSSWSSPPTELAAAYQLQVTGRYAHSAEYLKQTAVRTGWEMLLTKESIIRYNAGQPIWGYLCVLRRNDLLSKQ